MPKITEIKHKIDMLSAGEFQILCDEYLTREGYPKPVGLGTKAGTSGTTKGTPDTYFCKVDGKYVFVEYTIQKDGLAAKIEKDLEKCLKEEETGVKCADISKIIYCHRSSNLTPGDDFALHEMCRKGGIPLEIIGIDYLAAELKNKYPTIAKDILGVSVDTQQIQSKEEFVRAYDANALAATLDTEFQYREDELKHLADLFAEADVVILKGKAGNGKTRLALAFVEDYAPQTGRKLYCVRNHALPLYEDVCLYFEKPGKYFVLVDDANQLSDLCYIVEQVNKKDKQYDVKILMTVRDYALEDVTRTISEIVRYKELAIEKLTDEQIRNIVEKNCGIKNSNYLERIVEIADGNARMAMLAGKIALEKNRLDSIQDATQLYDAYYGDAFDKAHMKGNSKLQVAAGIVAFLNAVHLDRIDPLEPILHENVMTVDDFVNAVHELHESEIVDICHDKAVSFSDQCFENFVLKYVFYDKRRISLSAMIEICFQHYRERTIQALNKLTILFRTEEVHNFIGEEVKKIWEKWDKEQNPNFWGFVRTFYPVNEVEALVLIQNKIEETESVDLQEEIDINEEKSIGIISDDTISILGGYATSKNIDAAMDLFFQYYLKRPDLYIQFYKASTTLLGITNKSEGQGFYTQVHYLHKMIEYSDHWKNKYITALFIKVAADWLQVNFSYSESGRTRNSIVMHNISLADAVAAKEYRELIWTELISIADYREYRTYLIPLLRGYMKSMPQCSHGIVRIDQPYVCELLEKIFAPDNLEGCLLAKRISDVFQRADIQGDYLNAYLNSEKLYLYYLLHGPRPDLNHDYIACRELKNEAIKNYMKDCVRMGDCFDGLLEVTIEANQALGERETWVQKGLTVALQQMSGDKVLYIEKVKMVLERVPILTDEMFPILQTLFEMTTADEVLALITSSTMPGNLNNGLYAFYHELPDGEITPQRVEEMYVFLQSDTDKDLIVFPVRGIEFLNKYVIVDEAVFVKAARIILKKQDYSKTAVKRYFEGMILIDEAQAKSMIKLYDRDINLLEDIYIFMAQEESHCDYDGTLLRLLIKKDSTFIRKYAEEILSNPNLSLTDNIEKWWNIYDEENYADIIDELIDASEQVKNGGFYSMVDLLECFIAPIENNGERERRRQEWIARFISQNASNRMKMVHFFEAVSERPIEEKTEYVRMFLESNKDIDMFKRLPLIPNAWSWSGSLVPMYKGWIEFLTQVESLLIGITYIRHKRHVENLIDSLNKKIEDEEIKNIFER